MLICLDALFDVGDINRVIRILLHFFEDVRVARLCVHTNLGATSDSGVASVLILEPCVAHDLSEAVAHLRIGDQYVLNQIFDLITQVAREFVLCVEDLLIQTLRV